MRIEEQARATLRLHIFLFYDKQLVQIVTSSFSFILLLHHFHYSNINLIYAKNRMKKLF